MSLITGHPEDSPRDCSRSSARAHKHQHHHHHRRALVAVSSTVASLLSLALILWLTLRPSSPNFSMLAATATANASSATTSIIMITVDAALTAHNPNAHATAVYDQLQATASYAGVPLGGAAPLMPTPLEQPEGDVVLSAMLTTSKSNADWSWTPPPERALLRVRIQGQLRWKVATWVSATHGLTVDCIAAVLLQEPAAVPLPTGQGYQSSQCATHVQ